MICSVVGVWSMVGTKKRAESLDSALGDPGEARTLDPLIKSQLLYQLSYGVIRFISFLRCKGMEFF